MKSKIVALSKNEDFKNLLKKKKVSNKYITLFFGPLADKNNKTLMEIKNDNVYIYYQLVTYQSEVALDT